MNKQICNENRTLCWSFQLHVSGLFIAAVWLYLSHGQKLNLQICF